MRLKTHDGRELVLWLAKRTESIPACLADGACHDALLEFLEGHRLTGRFLDRSQGAPEQTRLEAAFAMTQESTIVRTLTALDDLARAVRSTSMDSVVIMKGPTTYILSGNRAHIRPSRDLDVWSSRPGELARHLLANGGVTASALVAQHEVASINLNGMKIDVHEFIPFARYTAVEMLPSLLELATVGAQVSERCTVDGLDMQMLLRTGTTSGGLPHPLQVFGATVSALIACVALTTDLAWEPWAPKSTRLVSLFEIHALSSHPEFEPARFEALVRAAGLETNVLMCARALQAYFPPSPLHAYSDGRSVLVQKLSNAIYGPWMVRSIDDVFLAGADASYDSLSPVLTTVPRSDAGMVRVPAENTIRWADTAEAQPRVEAHVGTDADSVVLTVDGETHHVQNVMLFFENGRYCDLVLSSDAAAQTWASPGTQHGHRVEDNSVRLAVGCGASDGHRVRGLAIVGGRANGGGAWSRVAPIVTAGS